MVTDTIILLLLFAIAAVVGIILWKGAVAKPYDPNAVDLSSDFDPKHDHFSADTANAGELMLTEIAYGHLRESDKMKLCKSSVQASGNDITCHVMQM